jgi:hypothetical protein
VIELTQKTRKLLKLLAATGHHHLEDLLQERITDTMAPSICMTEGCDHVADFEKDQTEGVCEACGSHAVTSVFVLADLI